MTQLVLLPGWAYSSQCLSPLADALSPTLPTRILTHRKAREQLPREPDPIWLGGWSLGALQAVDLAHTYPDKIQGLILIGFTARFCSDDQGWPGTDPVQVRSMAREVSRKRREVLTRFFEASAAPCSLTKADLETRMKAIQDQDDACLREGLTSLRTLDLRATCAEINQPTLLLAGKNDLIVPHAASEASARLFPNPTLITHDLAGHELPLREVAWMQQQILSWWN